MSPATSECRFSQAKYRAAPDITDNNLQESVAFHNALVELHIATHAML
jgi:hypothetical protein